MRAQVEAADCAFMPYRQARHPDPVGRVLEEEIADWAAFWCGHETAADVLGEIERDRVDCLVVDCMLPAALAAAERSGLAHAVVVHLRYGHFTEGPDAGLWDMVRPLVAATREGLGLADLSPERPVMSQLWEQATLTLATLPETFDPPLGATPANLRYVGPIFDDAVRQAGTDWRVSPGDPLVLVSLSSTNMRQEPVMQHVLDSLAGLDGHVLCTTGRMPTDGLRAPPNATVVGWVPHASVLPHAAAVVTHGGLWTIMAALARGVPLVCIPMGRDQHGNAARVHDLSAGEVVDPASPPDEVQATVTDVMSSPGYREAAVRMGEQIAAYKDGAQAVAALESLLNNWD